MSVTVGLTASNDAAVAPPGYDASFPECGKTLPSPAGFGIIGVNGGRAFMPSPCLPQEYAAALSGTSPTQAHLAFYMNTGNPGPALSRGHWPT